MSKIKTFKKLLKYDKRQILVSVYNNIVHTGITNLLPDEAYLKLTHRIRFGEKLHLDNPTTFNEKIQWLKLHDRNPDYIKMVDKVLVKDYVASIIGEEYIIPTLGVYDSFDEIDFNNLPDQFVLKCNHDSGSIVICRDKSKLDIKKAKKKLTKSLKTDAFFWGREWPYKMVKRKIIAEAYMEDDDAVELKDYKLMTFGGKVKCSFVGSERFSEDGLKITFFDTDWNIMPFEHLYPKSKLNIKKPLNYKEMVVLAENLAKDIPFDRIDFYEVPGKTYFGEVTLFPGLDQEKFNPSEWDMTLGSWVKLPVGVLLAKENVVIHFPFKKSLDLIDYKFFCFNGEPQYCQIITGRSNKEKIDFYDMSWNLQPFVGLTPLVGNSGFSFPRPVHFNEMKIFARKLSQNTSFSRIDFYEVQGKLYFGEFTLYPASGFGKFSPEEWNRKIGDMITIR